MLYLIIFVFQLTFSSAQEMNVRDSKKSIDKVIFVGGAGFNKTFIKYVAELTNKPDPKICYIPTATGDSPTTTLNWYANCEDLPLRPYCARLLLPTRLQNHFIPDYSLGRKSYS